MDQFVNLDEDVHCHLQFGTALVSIGMHRLDINIQYLEKVVSLLVRLSQQAEREGCHRVVAPRAKQCDKERLTVLSVCVSGWVSNEGDPTHAGLKVT